MCSSYYDDSDCSTASSADANNPLQSIGNFMNHQPTYATLHPHFGAALPPYQLALPPVTYRINENNNRNNKNSHGNKTNE